MAQAVLFDTHAFIKELKESGFEEKQAEALSGAIKKVQEAHLEELATKRDIKEFEAATKRDIEKAVSDAKVEIIKWVAGMLVAQAAVVATLVKLL